MRHLVPFLLSALFAGSSANTALAGSPVVDAFGEACLPERLSFEKSRVRAETIGWKAALASDNRELENVMQKGLAAASDPENPDWKMVYSLYSKPEKDRRLYLVLTRFHAPDVIALIGCYIYDFNASRPVEPELVSALLKHEIAYSTLDKSGDAYVDPDQIISQVWGPPPSLPRQFDTYLTFIPENSPLVKQTRFSGLVLKTSTSEPNPTDTK